MSKDYDASHFEHELATFIIIMVFTYIGLLVIKLLNGTKLPFTNFHIPSVWRWFKMPNLTGMIIFGMIARNLWDYMNYFSDEWGGFIRECCLCVILTSGGLELSFKDKKLLILMLSIIPLVFEGLTIAGLSKAWFGFPTVLCFSWGIVIAAVSPGVLIPTCMTLQKEGYGVEKGIPTTLIAAASFSDIIAIQLFGIVTEIELNSVEGKEVDYGHAMGVTFAMIIGGIVAGIITGWIVGYGLKPFKNHKKIKTIGILATLSIFVIIVTFTEYMESLFVAAITFAYILHCIWGDDKPQKELHVVLDYMKPYLFGTIGAAIKLKELDPLTIPIGFCIVLIGLVLRWLATYFWVWRKKFNMKERWIFVLAWIPKATVQAVLGSLVLDWSRKTLKEDNPHKATYEEYGLQILTIGIVSIFMTAPLGAILTENLGKKWLHKKEKVEHVKDKEGQEVQLPKSINAILPVIPEIAPDKPNFEISEASKSSRDSSQEDEEEVKSDIGLNLSHVKLPPIDRNALNPDGTLKLDFIDPQYNGVNDNSEVQELHMQPNLEIKHSNDDPVRL